MSQPTRDISITIFGATGFTGQYIVEEIYRTLSSTTFYPNVPAIPANLSWAIAGRSHEKLQELLDRVEARYNAEKRLPRPEILIADVTKREALNVMCKRSHVLINAVGPFRFMGEYVVRACVENGANYVDITGEPEFIERMQRTYHDEAKKNGVTIVHACGFDSVPSDMAVLWNKQQIESREHATPVQMEMYFTIKIGPHGMVGHFATFESAVYGFSSTSTLHSLREYSTLPKLPIVPGPKLVFHQFPHWNARIKAYTLPFVFADPSIVRLSQQLFLAGQAAVPDQGNAAMPPTVQFTAYFVFERLWSLILMVCYGWVFRLLADAPWGRNMLLRSPERFSAGMFSRTGPTRQQIETTRFESMFITRGFSTEALRVVMAHSDDGAAPVAREPDVEMVTRIEGPEAGYDSTPRIVVQCAYVMLEEKAKGRVPNGVVTPSVAFWRTELIRRLTDVGISFDVLETNIFRSS